MLSSRDDGMMISDLGRVEYSAAFGQGYTLQQGNNLGIASECRQDAGTLGIDVVSEVAGIDTWVGSELLLVERLQSLQGLLGGEAIAAVTVYL